MEIENRKLLPLFWLKIEDKVSRGIKFVNQNFIIDITGKQNNLFQDLLSLRWYENIKRSYEVIAEKRGVYSFGRGRLIYSGFFGLFNKYLSDSDSRELIVYPRVLPLSIPNINFSRPFGRKSSPGWIFKDELNRVGVRPYQMFDQMKDINWKTSARHLQLESNIYKPALDREIHIFLESRTGDRVWHGIDLNRFESGIISVSSLCEYCFKAGYQVGFYSNGLIINNSNYTRLRPGKVREQRKRIMTSLAMLRPLNSNNLSRIMQIEKKHIRTGSTVVVITAIMDNELRATLNHYRRGFKIVVIKLGERIKDILKGIEIYYLDEEDDWDEIETIKLHL